LVTAKQGILDCSTQEAVQVNLQQAVEEGRSLEILRCLEEGANVDDRILNYAADFPRFTSVTQRSPGGQRSPVSPFEEIAEHYGRKYNALALVEFHKKLNRTVFEIMWMLKQIKLKGPGGSRTVFKLIFPYINDYFRSLHIPVNRILKKSEAYKLLPIDCLLPDDISFSGLVSYRVNQSFSAFGESWILACFPLGFNVIAAYALSHYFEVQGIPTAIFLAVAPLSLSMGWKGDAALILNCLLMAAASGGLKSYYHWNGILAFSALMSMGLTSYLIEPGITSRITGEDKAGSVKGRKLATIINIACLCFMVQNFFDYLG